MRTLRSRMAALVLAAAILGGIGVAASGQATTLAIDIQKPGHGSLAEDIQKPGHGSLAEDIQKPGHGSLAEDIQKPGHGSLA